MMKIIVITVPEFLPAEGQMIKELLEAGADRVHVRKPGSSEAGFRRLLEAIPQDCRPAVTLQDHIGLASEYGFGGVHLNSRNPSVPYGYQGLVSRSCHSLEEVAANKDLDYVFLSPIYDSISKTGYKSGLTREELATASKEGIIGEKTVALGGVTPSHLTELQGLGFGGAAFLGYIWKDATVESIGLKIKEIKKFCDASIYNT